jgi:hypothetical protein
MRVYWFLTAIVILTYCAFNAVNAYSLPNPPNRIGPEQLDLSNITQVGTNIDLINTWIDSSASSLIFYIMPKINDRTAVVGNEYATAVQIGSTSSAGSRLNILVAPDAGRSVMMAPAVLEIFINGQNDPDVIDINNIYLQKWNCVVIVKQGRLFNIYVNGVLSVSHTCTAMPKFDNTQPIRVGDPRLGGTIALMSLAPYAMQINDVQNIMKETTDTSNKPYLSSELPSLPEFSIPGLTNFMCPGGNCSSNKMPGPMFEWASNYA